MFIRFFPATLLIVFTLSLVTIAGNYKLDRATKVTSEDEAKFSEILNGITDYTPAQANSSQTAIELGRTWYDYATNNVMGRMLAHAYGSGDDGIHAVFMKRVPNATATRYVSYDYYNEGLGLFLGNLDITTSRQTGWGRVINGKNDEAIVSLHADPSELYFDAGEASYSFTSKLGVNPGVFAGFGVHGDSIVFLTEFNNVAGTAWMPGNNAFKYSTDYGATWSDGANIPPPAGAVEFSEAERWPQFNPADPSELGLATAIDEDPDPLGSIGGWLIYATTSDWGANWTSNDFWYDDVSVTSSPFGDNTMYNIENFTQMNYMYSSDGNFHIVYGAVQGVRDTSTSTAIDYWPILHWDSNSGTFSEVTTLDYSAPNDVATMTAMSANRPGNGLGNAYPHIAEGPNGTLVCIWQQWEKDINGNVVLLNATTGGGTGTFQVFATDIWAAYSNDGGATWQGQTYIAGESNQSDVYPNIPRDVIRNGDSLYLDILYMYDTNPNVSFSNFTNFTDPSECIWYYERVAIYAPSSTGIGDQINLTADDYSLSQNYPNPFNPSTTITFNIQKRAKVTLEVYNTVGQKVKTLVNGVLNPGAHEVEFSGNDLTSGIYFYQLAVDNFKSSKKMVLMK